MKFYRLDRRTDGGTLRLLPPSARPTKPRASGASNDGSPRKKPAERSGRIKQRARRIVPIAWPLDSNSDAEADIVECPRRVSHVG